MYFNRITVAKLAIIASPCSNVIDVTTRQNQHGGERKTSVVQEFVV